MEDWDSNLFTNLNDTDNDYTLPETTEEDKELVSESVFDVVDTILSCFVITSIGLFGTVGNILNIIILVHHGLRDSTNAVLMSLSVSDLLYVSLTAARRAGCIVSYFNPVAGQIFHAFQAVYLLTVTRLFSHISCALIVFISMRRLTAVYFPLKARILCSLRTSFVYLALLPSLWIVLTIPFFPVYSFSWKTDPLLNITVGQARISEYGLSHWEALSTLDLFRGYLKGPIHMLVILTCSVCIAVKLRAASKMRKEMTSKKSRGISDVRVEKMLLFVCLVYLGAGLPLLGPSIFYVIRPDLIQVNGNVTNLFLLLEIMYDLLTVTKSSANFLIYVTISTKFYKTYAMLFKPKCIKSKSELECKL
ncbi:uncharacterized protein LOC101845332 [Aplysia californica]|uniref:Uncharacterized protein LOC101845332 n=1 Tax=Aplysia californica TaxID=6500 RepID=A0ABM0JRI8_APLCA|nr:uncharacterized protein LOC101845332 [Aplysia californica]